VREGLAEPGGTAGANRVQSSTTRTQPRRSEARGEPDGCEHLTNSRRSWSPSRSRQRSGARTTDMLSRSGHGSVSALLPGRSRRRGPGRRRCKPCVRTVDIDVIGTTSRHRTFFEMLGTSASEYIKDLAIAYAWELLTGSGFLDPEQLWVRSTSSDARPKLSGANYRPASEVVCSGSTRHFWKMGETDLVARARRSSSTGDRSRPGGDRSGRRALCGALGTWCSSSMKAP